MFSPFLKCHDHRNAYDSSEIIDHDKRETLQTLVMAGGHLSCFAVCPAVQRHQQLGLMLHHSSYVTRYVSSHLHT